MNSSMRSRRIVGWFAAITLAGSALVATPAVAAVAPAEQSSGTFTVEVPLANSATSGKSSHERPMWDWNHYEDKNKDKNYWGVQGTVAKVGYDPAGSGQWRTAMRFWIDPIFGATIVSARVKVAVAQSTSCDASKALNLHVGTVAPQHVTWNNAGVGAWQQSAWGCGTDQGLWFESSNELRGTLQRAATERSPGGVNFTLTSAAAGVFKTLTPGATRLVVEYNHAPNAPANLNLAPAKPCGFGADRTFLTTAQPQFSATLSDPNSGDAVGARLEIRKKSDGAVIYQDPPGAPVLSVPATGGNKSWAAVPAGVLSPGVSYTYHAAAWDGAAWSAWTNGCEFEVDLGPAGTPLVSSPCDPPACDPEFGMPMGTARAVTIAPAPGDTDVVRYAYGTGPEAGQLGMTVAAGPDGTATVPITQWTSDPSWLFVRSVDRAGNLSTGTASFSITAKHTTTSPARRRGDANGDGLSDVSATFSGSGTQNSLFSWVSTSTGSFAPVGTELNNSYPAGDIKTVQGDFDGDGLTDSAMLRQENNGRVTVWVQRFDGSKYRSSSSAALDSTGAIGWYTANIKLVAADFDGDQLTDLGMFYGYGGCQTKLFVFYSTGTAFTNSFGQVAWDSGAGNFCWDRIKPVTGDFNGDRRQEVGIFYRWDNACDWSIDTFRQPAGRFAIAKTATGVKDSGCSDWNRVKPVAADFDGDGKDDLGHLYNNDSGRTSLWTLTSNGNLSGATFGAETLRWDSGNGVWNWNDLELSGAELDGTAAAEVAVVERSASTQTALWSLRRAADGTYTRKLNWDGRVQNGLGLTGWGASLNGDRRADLVRIAADGKLLGAANIDGLHGAFGTSRVSATGATDPTRGQFADLDGDGKKDYVYLKPDGVLRGYPNVDGLNDGYGTGRPIGSGFPDPARLRFADLDGDHREDLIRIDADGTIQAWPNVDGLANSWGTQRKIGDGFTDPGRVRFADLDGDGRAELISTDSDGIVRARPNVDGKNNNWGAARQVGNSFTDPARTFFADLDGDGKAEILKVESNGDLTAWPNLDALNGTWRVARTVSTGWTDPTRLRLP